jgi:protein phosphatase
VQVTRDQSLVNQLIEAGQLTEEEAETFEHNNIILQALGTADTVQVDLTYVQLMRGDVLMMCSDGLSGMVRNDELREVLKSCAEPLEACKALTERANLAGGHDNITVIVARFDGEGLRPLDESEPLKYRKYTLPQDEATEPGRRVVALGPTIAPPSRPRAGGSGDGESPVHHFSADEERVDIPGTHVPAGVVIGLIVLVIALLGGTAFLLLR